MVKLIAGQLQGLAFADPKSLSATGQIDETGVDLQSYAHLIFSDLIEAKISCAINEDFSNNLVISNGKYSISISDPWHCGQFHDGISSIHLSHEGRSSKEIKCIDETGLFSREIEHAAKCILESKIESKLICHAETQSNMFWLDHWRQEMKIDCPKAQIKNSPILLSTAYFLQESNLEKHVLPGLSKLGSRLALGCDNQTSDLHAFTMFDHFYGSGGRIFDTAFIYNHGMGDKYLGDWINARNVEKDVIVLGKGAHTPECEPKYIRPQVLESLDRLQISKLDIFCLHRDNPDIPVDEFIDALAEVKNEGLVNLIGASNWEMDRFSEARNYAVKTAKEPFTVLSNNFSLAEMIEPVWPGCVGVNDQYLKYLLDEQIMLFPWSSQARGFFIKKKEIMSNEHFSNPTLDEEMRVWHHAKNLQRRQVCFEMAKERNVQPIQIALAYVLKTSELIFPLIGPRTISESNSSIQATQLELTASELQELAQG
jgi:aryl-alcohol dehydrogenase-like predicted oxidoreductase